MPNLNGSWVKVDVSDWKEIAGALPNAEKAGYELSIRIRFAVGGGGKADDEEVSIFLSPQEHLWLDVAEAVLTARKG